MTVTVNGEPRSLPEGATVADLVERLGLGQRACAVEVDRCLVPRKSHAEHRLNAGANVEIVTLVGGG
jgi:thiamine biosynthesis protein ThiS